MHHSQDIAVCAEQAVMVVADAKQSLTITGNGDVLEPYDGVIGKRCIEHTCVWHVPYMLNLSMHVCCAAAIGSGGSYALAAARALIDLPELTAEEVAKKAMTIAADTCIYTNHNFTTETLDSKTDDDD